MRDDKTAIAANIAEMSIKAHVFSESVLADRVCACSSSRLAEYSWHCKKLTLKNLKVQFKGI